MKLKLAIVFVVLLSASLAVAQSVNLTGTWKAKTVSARGSSEQTIDFKQAGASFTGEMTNAQGVKETIKDGKVTGNDISFSISRKQASGNMADVVLQGDGERRRDHRDLYGSKRRYGELDCHEAGRWRDVRHARDVSRSSRVFFLIEGF